MKWPQLLASFLALMTAPQLFAQADPVDKNFGGPYAGGQVVFGQGLKVGDSSPGVAWLMSGDIGYGIKRDTWNRLELGFEVGTGGASFKDKDNGGVDVDIDMEMVAMLKGGYGYSLGQQAFGIFRLGAGIAKSSFEGRAAGIKVDGGSSTGLVSMIGWDAVYMASEKLDLLAGASFRFFNYNFKDLPGDTGDFQMNMPAIYAGARFRL